MGTTEFLSNDSLDWSTGSSEALASRYDRDEFVQQREESPSTLADATPESRTAETGSGNTLSDADRAGVLSLISESVIRAGSVASTIRDQEDEAQVFDLGAFIVYQGGPEVWEQRLRFENLMNIYEEAYRRIPDDADERKQALRNMSLSDTTRDRALATLNEFQRLDLAVIELKMLHLRAAERAIELLRGRARIAGSASDIDLDEDQAAYDASQTQIGELRKQIDAVNDEYELHFKRCSDGVIGGSGNSLPAVNAPPN